MSNTRFEEQNCPVQEEMIHLYLDGALSLSERESFEIHLKRCQNCQIRLAAAAILFEEITSLADVAAPGDIVNQVMASLPAAVTAPQLSSGPYRRRAGLSGLILTGQVVIGLTLIVFLLPAVTAALNDQRLWLPWVITSEMFRSLSSWVSSLTIEFGHQLQTWPETIKFAWLELSPLVAIALVVGLGLAWLIGNTMLLSLRQPISKNGGV